MGRKLRGRGRGPTEANIGVPREPLVRTPGYMGHVREVKGKILVARHVQEHARLREYVQKLPDALGGLTPRRATPHIPSDRALQMDGRRGYDADGRRAEAIPRAN